MKFFDKFFGKDNISDPAEEPDNSLLHCVVVFFKYGRSDIAPFYDLEDELLQAIDQNNVGQYDWHEMNEDNSDGSIYMYGPNAQILYDTIKPILEKTDFMKGAIAVLRFGPLEEGTKEIEIEIGNN